jgi:methyl-accepting chemotaxis protein
MRRDDRDRGAVMQIRQLSVQTKVLTGLVAVFAVLMIATTWHTARTERAMVEEVAVGKAKDVAHSYFDGVNTMMLTGTTNQRDLLREKFLAHEDVTEVRLIRANGINAVFGPGNPEQVPMDDLDRRALAGEDIMSHGRDADGRVITVLAPVRASKDFRGTNCLTCHQVPEDTVLGATRVSYSLARLDGQINRNLLTASAINIGMLLVGLALLAWLLRHVVARPLAHIRDVMLVVERDADLGQRLDVRSGDEIGQLSQTFNAMLEHFGQSLRQVSDGTGKVASAAHEIAAVAGQTAAAANQQRGETDSVATAINQLEATAVEVQNGAASAAEASVEADRTAAAGATTTRAAIDGIHALVGEIEGAAQVIERLDERSKSVGAVLDVIKGIAEQTNLLALNAAIEAARAGDKGRGFAVVADEVRTLATRSHTSTQEIEKIVAQLQTEAREAVTAMAQARSSAEERRRQVQSADAGLTEIAERVASIRELNARMAHAAQEQSMVTENVSRNVANISQLAERTASDAEQTNAVSSALLGYSAELQQLVERFRY